MLTGDAILCFAPDPWDDIWRNRHQIMSRLAQQNRVMYVEPRPYLRPVLHRLAKVRPFHVTRAQQEGMRGSQLRRASLEGSGDAARADTGGLWVYHPPWYAPLSGQPLLIAAHV